MRVLVTGAAGFIGSNLVDRVLDRGDHVTGVDSFDPFYSPAEKRANLAGALSESRFRLIEGDITEREAMGAAVAGARPDVIVHLAAKSGVRPSLRDPAGYERVNVAGTRAVLDAAARHGVKAFVFGSSSSVYGNTARLPFREDDVSGSPVSPYAATKRVAEDACRAHQQAHGGSTLCLRLFTVYGPRQRPDLAIRRFCTLMSARQSIPVFGDGTSERDYTWVGDVVDGIVAAVDRATSGHDGFEIINLGAGRAVPLMRLVGLLGASLGVDPVVEHRPEHPGDVSRTCADLTKAGRLLAYAPRVGIEEGVPRFVHWLKASGGGP